MADAKSQGIIRQVKSRCLSLLTSLKSEEEIENHLEKLDDIKRLEAWINNFKKWKELKEYDENKIVEYLDAESDYINSENKGLKQLISNQNAHLGKILGLVKNLEIVRQQAQQEEQQQSAQQAQQAQEAQAAINLIPGQQEAMNIFLSKGREDAEKFLQNFRKPDGGKYDGNLIDTWMASWEAFVNKAKEDILLAKNDDAEHILAQNGFGKNTIRSTLKVWITQSNAAKQAICRENNIQKAEETLRNKKINIGDELIKRYLGDNNTIGKWEEARDDSKNALMNGNREEAERILKDAGL